MQASAKRGLWIVLATLVAVGIVALVATRQRSEPPGLLLPAFDGAEVPRYDADGNVMTKLLNPADVARLRTELEAAKWVRNDRKWISIPGIRLLHAGVEVQEIDLLWNGHELFFFVVGGEYYQARPGGQLWDLLEINDWPGR